VGCLKNTAWLGYKWVVAFRMCSVFVLIVERGSAVVIRVRHSNKNKINNKGFSPSFSFLGRITQLLLKTKLCRMGE
jgi:hypothetical protein